MKVQERPAQPISSAMATDFSGAMYSVNIDPSLQWAISQFWHPGQRKLHPTLPRESHRAPVRKWKTGFFSMGLTDTEETSP